MNRLFVILMNVVFLNSQTVWARDWIQRLEEKINPSRDIFLEGETLVSPDSEEGSYKELKKDIDRLGSDIQSLTQSIEGTRSLILQKTKIHTFSHIRLFYPKEEKDPVLGQIKVTLDGVQLWQGTEDLLFFPSPLELFSGPIYPGEHRIQISLQLYDQKDFDLDQKNFYQIEKTFSFQIPLESEGGGTLILNKEIHLNPKTRTLSFEERP
jgi:hypothetical protein